MLDIIISLPEFYPTGENQSVSWRIVDRLATTKMPLGDGKSNSAIQAIESALPRALEIIRRGQAD